MKFFKKKWVLISLGIILVVGGLLFAQSRKKAVPEFSSQPVERIDLKQTVSETGSVEASLELTYGWEASGKVTTIGKHIGDTVTSTDVIATLDSTQQRARYNQAVASLSSSQAQLNLQLAGPSDEVKKKSSAAIAQAQASLLQSQANLSKVEAQSSASIINAQKTVDTAKNNLQLVATGEDSNLVNNAYADLVNILKSSVTNLGNALTASDNILGIDNVFANDTFESVLGIQDSIALQQARNSYYDAQSGKNDAAQVTLPLDSSSDHASVDAAQTVVADALSVMQTHLSYVQQTLTATRPIGNLTQSSLDTLKSGITTVQGYIDTSATNVTNGMQAISTARNSLTSYHIAYDKAVSDLDQAKKQTDADIAVAHAQVSAQEANLAQAQASYDDLVAPPRTVDLASLRADVSRQAAALSAARDDLKKTELLALSDGVVSRLDVEVGENVIANQDIVGIISAGFTIKVDISEADIAKVSVNNSVDITLDAYGDDVHFAGHVVKIEPSQTEISGVVYYKTTILFDHTEEHYDIRSGMTANIDILTDSKDGVLVIPRRAILTQDGKKIVRVVKDATKGVFEERDVQTGLPGDDGLVEITSGLTEGEVIVTFLKES
ncbi:MAG: hypothetical protein COX82_02020 [Candidatus Magasanikbacteria bacterium CG_4_10_14_0_2_um_filter_41_10]|uniref:Membrane fusion protein biotin-lipoyl like domain-containing protein n=1 Tax=Candidatus Magasanikbacteria bacterium CG_4_10_14_0_2_um_filter_41_10 TaxID=1974638 RepID=A0A2M7V599_9BACT|nr:MAG: hypothetical protein COX82_02020 [Candidatus Magasanikbacteria bacterium CG_4_10_14_0_2_um_filter_41_10]